MLSWFENNDDLIALLISLLALLVGLATTMIAVRQARLATYARMHEALVQPDTAAGRKLLFLAADNGTFPSVDSPDWDKINHALTMYDTLGVYVRRRLVPRRLVLSSWHQQMVAIKEPAEAFQKHREQLGISQPWVGLDYLFAEAARYRGAVS